MITETSDNIEQNHETYSIIDLNLEIPLVKNTFEKNKTEPEVKNLSLSIEILDEKNGKPKVEKNIELKFELEPEIIREKYKILNKKIEDPKEEDDEKLKNPEPEEAYKLNLEEFLNLPEGTLRVKIDSPRVAKITILNTPPKYFYNLGNEPPIVKEPLTLYQISAEKFITKLQWTEKETKIEESYSDSIRKTEGKIYFKHLTPNKKLIVKEGFSCTKI